MPGILAVLHRTLCRGLWGGIVAVSAVWASATLPAAPPNIVILFADDMGYGDLAIQNPESKIPTPHLDQLAREGMRFTDGHSSSGICTPSRYALLTGRYHWRKFHDIVHSFGQPVIDAEELTLAEMLRESGYHTGCIGKWHLGWDWKAIIKPDAQPTTRGRNLVYQSHELDWSKPIPGGPVSHGFNTYFGDDIPNFPPYTWYENDRVTAVPSAVYAPDPVPTEGAAEGRPGPMVPGWKQDQVMPTLTAKAVEWIAQQKGTGKPFFLYFPWTSPHAPIVPTTDWQGKSQAGGYGDFMAQSDWTAGEVLKALDEHGFRDNTIVIFTADNGPEQYAYNRLRNFNHRSAGPLRGLKRDIWEGGHRVPFVIRWPGVVEPGRVSDALISQIDLFATIAAIVEYDLPPTAADDSLNQLPLLRGGPEAKSARTTLVHNTKANHYAIRSGDWVLIDAPTGGISAVPPWFDVENGYTRDGSPAALYNLRTDLGQRQNLIQEQSDTANKLRSELNVLRESAQRTHRPLPKVVADGPG